ncbi:hypothetical protein TSUD_393250 [Trifolium subterraneum]|uniref:Uncharacterized protein n=1 Tax=Trifolium subterraneum TaxID=3900 RepID=A0A2Z6MVC9_TRISU|nr:hypothetical protein TSUD_393250 [Trifolium subterraneum]
MKIFDEQVKPHFEDAQIQLTKQETAHQLHAKEVACSLEITKHDGIVCWLSNQNIFRYAATFKKVNCKCLLYVRCAGSCGEVYHGEWPGTVSDQLQAEIAKTHLENEAFVKVFGKEHRGFACSMGLGVTPSQLTTTRAARLTSSSEANEKMNEMQAEIDRLKDKASRVDILKE